METPMFRMGFAIRRGGVRGDLSEMGGGGVVRKSRGTFSWQGNWGHLIQANQLIWALATGENDRVGG